MSSHPAINVDAAKAYVSEKFTTSIVPCLHEYIKIPNKSPAFDPDWEKHGHMNKAMNLIVDWCKQNALDGMTLEVLQLPGRTPLLFIDVPGNIKDTVLLYGHMDKQPEMVGWDDDLGPWKPVRKGDKLYGRGGADDGYSTFASLTALGILQKQGIPHARCVIVIEGCEESGSADLPFYIEHLSDRIGTPSLVVCLDSGAGNYDQMWCTTSLRGNLVGNLHVEVIKEGVHSGDASGIVPSSFRILRSLLSRIEDQETGAILPKELHCSIPEQRQQQAAVAAQVLGDGVWNHFPFHDGAHTIHRDNTELVLNRSWRPQLAVTGAGGFPALGSAGNVMRPCSSVRLSLRLPPEVESRDAEKVITRLLTTDVPYGARVRFESEGGTNGWNAPPLASWLESAMNDASTSYFGKPSVSMGEGGTIPFMGMLGEKFPNAQFMITGVLGPESNAHGPNEFLHIPTAEKLSCCVAETIRQHAFRSKP